MGTAVFKWGGGVLYNTRSGWISLALGQDPCTQTMTSLNICAWLSIVNSTLASIHHHLLLSDHLLPSDYFCLSWPFHIFGSVPQDQSSHMCIMGSAWPSGSYHC